MRPPDGRIDPDLPQAIEDVIASTYFDADYYRAQDVALREIADLARHYVTTGWRDGLNPSARFDTASYLSVNHDVRAAGMNPLVHFVRWGKSEGRSAVGARGGQNEAQALARAVAPPAEAWSALVRPLCTEAPVVDVIVPVFEGFAETMRCLYSVLAAPVETAFELWVVDDASPNVTLSNALRALAASGRINLFRNATNRGFVQTCNFATGMHPARDIVLLNADTEVFAGWLDRLRAASRRPKVGTVTPFSNNAEICSYPRFLRNNDRQFELPDAELAVIVAEANAGQSIDLPTAVGFCMYVRRDCLAEVGPFDERFGRGYGEENDFCVRAGALGWRHVLGGDVFVRHYGGTSFGESKPSRLLAASEMLAALHPAYHVSVRRFIQDDPVQALRRRIDFARIRRAAHGRTFLFVTHMRGGGTERHVNDLVQGLISDRAGVLYCRAEDGPNSRRLQLAFPLLDTPNLPPVEISADGVAAFASALRAMGVVHLHVHQLVDCPPETAEFLRVVAARAEVAYDVTIHDYFTICPRITLTDASGNYCGEPDEDGCARCLGSAGSPLHHVSISAWRGRFAPLLRDARAVFVPNEDVERRMWRYVPGARYVVQPHPEAYVSPPTSEGPPLIVPAIINGALVRRIGLIGAIGRHKGSRVLAACARIARELKRPLSFGVIGYTDIDEELRALGVTVAGRYRDQEIDELVARAQFDAIWYPSVWPETYCYTLSVALRAGVFPVSFDIGAIAERLRCLDWGHVMPIEMLFEPARIVEELVALRITPAPDEELLTALPAGSFIDQYYGLQIAGDRTAWAP